MDYDVIIIGAGLGGLECGYILSKEGLNVCVLEQNAQLGGCLQSFRRGNTVFDTGFHYVGGLREGEGLHTLFRYFNLLHLPWYEMDKAGFDEVIIGNQSFCFANGFDHFADSLSSQFPNQRDNLRNYSSFLKQIADNQLDILSPNPKNLSSSQQWLGSSAYLFLQNTISDSLLQTVLSGTSIKMELDEETLPLYIFGQINCSFIQSAWRLKGGSYQIADSLAQQITNAGGTVRKNAKVTEIQGDNKHIEKLILNGQEELSAQFIISDIHPQSLLPIISTNLLKKAYRSRIGELRNSLGMFTAHLKLKKDTVLYQNRNLFIHQQPDLWHPFDHLDQPSVMVHFAVPNDLSPFADNIDILTSMSWDEVAKWQNSQRGERAGDYENWKVLKANQLIKIAADYIPKLDSSVEAIYTSSPLTYADYIATPEGSAYGICKDYNNLIFTMLPAKTGINNLFYTGQNMNFNGILGVSITSFLTCKELLGHDWLYRALK